MKVEWNDALVIGVKEIDSQHRELLNCFDRLLMSCRTGQGTDELKNTLLFLEEYTRTHFDDEEALQRQHHFPGYEAHHAEHNYFISRIKALREEVDQHGVLVHNVIETNHLLLKWFLNHVAKMDTELGNFLKSAGS